MAEGGANRQRSDYTSSPRSAEPPATVDGFDLLDPLDDDDEPELDALELLDPPELEDEVELVLELEALDEDEDEDDEVLLELAEDEEDDAPVVIPDDELLVGLVVEPAQAARTMTLTAGSSSASGVMCGLPAHRPGNGVRTSVMNSPG